MKYNPNPKKGDPVRVRMPSGKIVVAAYDGKLDEKEHFVLFKNDLFVCSSEAPRRPKSSGTCARVRFVYPVEGMRHEAKTL
jgi:hypothetical protein